MYLYNKKSFAVLFIQGRPVETVHQTEAPTPNALMQTGIATVKIHQLVMSMDFILLVIVMRLGTQFTAIVNAVNLLLKSLRPKAMRAL
jgi:hypothetical protein